MSSKPTYSAPAALGGVGRIAGLGENQDAHGLAAAVRQRNRAANHLVGLLGIHAQRNARSMVSLNLALGNLARTSTASFSG
jgi:hypothetical protein